MADTYGYAGKVLRVDLTTGAITTESTDKYTAFLGGTGIGWKVMWDEVPPTVGPLDPENRVVFAVGPVTGSGSPCSGRTSICTRWPLHPDALPAAGHMGGHWGPELKYAGYDALIVQGKAAHPVWLRIEDDVVSLEDARDLWGQGIYRTNNAIENIMGVEAHVAAIGQAGENLSPLAAVFCDRSHRAGGVGSVLGSKNLKAIGVRGTGAVNVAADKAAWKSLNKYYLSLMGANNQCVVARELQAWSEYSPGNTRWSGKKGLFWGSALPPVETGYCPDVEHANDDAPTPLNKIGLRTQKGFNDFGAEGEKRVVRMDGCHACPIRCHIAADHPELENYGVSRYNMNTCMGNSGLSRAYTNSAGSNPQQNPMLLAYMGNNLEGDYGIWTDYGGFTYVTNFLLDTTIVADEFTPATVDDPAHPGTQIPNPLIGKKLIQKYISAAEWTKLNTTALWNSGKSPLALRAAGDPRWAQFFAAQIAANVAGTFGALIGMGPPRLEQMIPELHREMNANEGLHFFKMGHTLHHSIESANQIGGFVNVFGACRDANNHTAHNFYTNGLPNSAANPLKRAIAQEIATNAASIFNAPDESADGKWAYPLTGEENPMNRARAAFTAKAVIWYELQNSLTECNYTLPVWASPLKSRNYRGDETLNVQVLNAVTGQNLTQQQLETIGLRIYTLWRVLTARYMEHAKEGAGANMRQSFDWAYDCYFKPENTDIGSWTRDDFEVGKDMMYEQFRWDPANGLPTEQQLAALGLNDTVATLKAEGILPSAT